MLPRMICGARRDQVAVEHRLDRSLRADRHERGGLHVAVRRLEPAEPRAAVGRAQGKAEGCRHVSIRVT